ncbi:MAG: CCA tRNA nucleotidyltransferase [Rhodospirillales bacterium]|nr:CCA tRNA nucleotidyltransferase [Rhodospirillales bacterium]MCB9973236.1 CCA tRNA nucleotidyltransferase [Rhodospirillales bacterium]MCB9980734.1 CCA tRNA nucleotidyltransferase [Rhodospirillales bacterium]
MMTPARHISPYDWMAYPECRVLMDVLHMDQGTSREGPVALFVGGCVRNLLANRPVQDLDVATKLPPDIVQKMCEESGFTTIPTGIAHGTITVVIGARSFEVTTLRRDVATDGRRATIAFSDSWVEDALRRDFTMNTLLADLDGNIYDPVGQGVADLKAGRVLFVGNAAQRIQEDYLRILRYFRFFADYGRGAPDPEALSACEKYATSIKTLSKERISQEFFRILLSEKSVSTLNLMRSINLLLDVIPLGADMDAFAELVRRQDQFYMVSLPARLFALAQFSPDRIGRYGAEYFVWSNACKSFFEKYARRQASSFHLSGLKELMYREEREVAGQYILANCPREQLDEAVSVYQNWPVPVLPLRGKDLISAGIPAGPDLGRYLAEIETWWILHDFEPDKAACLAYLQKECLSSSK